MTKRKLIEVALPLEAINRESAREKSIRHGHPSTLHLWWARRPLAACRAIIFASLVDDPSSHPDRFPTEDAQEAERRRLFRIIEDLVKWENTTNETVLDAARNEILDSCDGNPPPIYDPFCGGGSIPLEAQRLGLEAHGSDLNPVAVLITKALVEIPPKFANRPPVHPGQEDLGNKTWRGAQGLAEDVRWYARLIRELAWQELASAYPVAELADGSKAAVIAWLWCRTIHCPNPACGGTAPLLNSFAVSTRKGKEVWLHPVADAASGRVDFEIRNGEGCPKGGTVSRTGGQCLICSANFGIDHIRSEGATSGLGLQLISVVGEGKRRRHYVNATQDQVAAASVERPVDAPSVTLSTHPQYMGVTNYGLTESSDLFTDRQLASLTTFARLVNAARDEVIADGGDSEYADALATYLALGVGRLANRLSTQCFWDPPGEKVNQVFARNALPMVWVFAEANPFSDSSGNFLGQIEYLAKALSALPARGSGSIRQLDARRSPLPNGECFATDPPYYDNVPYADLSDFFYPWLRAMLRSVEPELFATIGVPKQDELVADSTRHGGRSGAKTFFEAGLGDVFSAIASRQASSFPCPVFYAFRQSESDTAGQASTGWETMLQGLVDGGLAITGTWPIRTEQTGGLREFGRNALASSIVLACRARDVAAGVTDRRSLLSSLREELPSALRRLQQGNIAPVDLAQSAIGPGIAVFSRYAKVVEADGSAMSVRTALGLINQVLDEVLSEQEGDFDADTRWAVAWFEQYGMNPGPFGIAETLSKAKNTGINGLVDAGVLESKAGKVRLLDRSELSVTWDPASDERLPVWEVTQHLIRAHEVSEQAAAELLRKVGGLGEVAKELAYRLYTICERKKWAKEALAYNALVVAWPEIVRLAASETLVASGPTQEELL
jgi:putative DNA methylase